MSSRLSTKLTRRYRAVVTGGSAGGVEALTQILAELPADFGLPLLAVQHLHPNDAGALALHLDRLTALQVVEPCDKERIEPGRLYVAPANYHMLVEDEGFISLSTDAKVNWSRPSIDVLFESASRVWGRYLVGVLLSGANQDGTSGLCSIRKAGGLTVVQEPSGAVVPVMPQSAIDAGVVDKILPPQEIGALLLRLGGNEASSQAASGRSTDRQVRDSGCAAPGPERTEL